MYLPKNLPSWLIPRLRRIAVMWPGKTIARDQAKVLLPNVLSQKGKPLKRVGYICAECKRQGIDKIWKKDEVQMDHISPVVDISGFTNWDDYINNLFCSPEHYQCLCKPHHEAKTQSENKDRRVVKKVDKLKKI
jgi:hypothetical protein